RRPKRGTWAGSVLLVARAPAFGQLLLHLRGHRLVMAEVDGVAAAPGGDRLQFGGVAVEFGERDLGPDHDVAVARGVGAVDARTLAGKAGVDVSHVRLGRLHLQGDDGLEHLGPGLGDRIQERLAAGGDEGDFLAVHRVVLAVVHGDAHVLDRVAGDGAGAQHLAHAFFHRGDQRAGDHAALDRVHELEAAAARQRLDAQEYLAELPGAPGLLPVPVMAFGGGADRLAIGDAR